MTHPMKTKRVVAFPGSGGGFSLTKVRISHQPKSPPILGKNETKMSPLFGGDFGTEIVDQIKSE